MRFVHIADVHLGMKPDVQYPWGKEREKEIQDTFYRVIDFCNEKEVELLLIAGDLFHKQPTVKQLELVGYLLSKLQSTQVIIMAGNHDYAGHGCGYLKYQWDENVHFLEPGRMERIFLPTIQTYIYGQSYQQNNIREDIYEEVQSGKEEGYHILLAHGGDKNNIPFDLVKMKKKKFDYIALGHIHKSQRLSEHMAYSGSLEPLDKTETGKHGFIYGQLNGKELRLQFVSAASRRYIPLTIEINERMSHYEIFDYVKNKVSSYGMKNIYLITLEGKKDPSDPIDIERLNTAGNIIEVNDNTEPAYDYEQIFEENRDNMIGLFMQEMKQSTVSGHMKKKAMNYGLEALIMSRKEQE